MAKNYYEVYEWKKGKERPETTGRQFDKNTYAQNYINDVSTKQENKENIYSIHKTKDLKFYNENEKMRVYENKLEKNNIELGKIYTKDNQEYKVVEKHSNYIWAYDKKGDLHKIDRNEFKVLYKEK